jgi:hypothetical protein
MKKSLFIISCILSQALMVVGQQQKSGVKLLAKVKGKSILLRWAPTNPSAWLMGNKNGYKIDRYLITNKNQVVGKPTRIQLTPVPLKPRPKEQWEADAKRNDYSAIAAQAIYGSSFQVTMPQSPSMSEVVSRTQEQEQRFSFALFAADHSFQTAKLSALGFADSTVRKDERYLYRVYISNTDSKIKLDTGSFYLGLQDSVGLMPPMNLTAQFADRLVLLRWPKAYVQQQYTSFIIERSEGGGEFKQRSSKPFINTTTDHDAEIFFQALDSLTQNDVEYQYRIRGITPFGEIGPESERVSGKGFRTLNARATISGGKEEKGKVEIQWTTTGSRELIVGYYVERASNTNEKFEKLNSQLLGKDQSHFTDQKPLSTNYYRVKTVGENGQTSDSFPFMVQMVDSIPPAAPQGLKVKIDTTGVARLTWSANQEKDLKGYHVYRSNFSSAEFSQVNKQMLNTPEFADTVTLKALNKKIYYRIAAFDKRINRSLYSQTVEAELPDVVPPQPPQIIEINPQSSGLRIKWNKSSSEDVVSYRLERKPQDSTVWRLIRLFVGNDSTIFSDLTVSKSKTYQYRLIALDKAGHHSQPSNLVSGKALLSNLHPAIKNLTAKADRESKTITLQWKYDEKGVSKYLIYRAAGDEPISFYKTISGETPGFIDSNVKMNTIYKYRVKCVFRDGEQSGLSIDKEVKF